jgi:hypothetical protein
MARLVSIGAGILFVAACGPGTTDVLPLAGEDASGGSSSGMTPPAGSSGGTTDGGGSGDDAVADSAYPMDSSVSAPPVDASLEGGPASPSDSGSSFGPPGCPNPLGSVWRVTETDNACGSTWTRQGSTVMFVDKDDAPCAVMATVTVTLSNTDVSAYWTSSSDNDDCQYLGTMSSDCSSVTGLYTCAAGDAASGMWTATIQ